MTMNLLTRDMASAVLDYDPETGVFKWKKSGAIAGSLAATGYRVINISRATGPLYAHRLAWLLMTGKWPSQSIDHINRDKTDNRWKNLRDAAPIINSHNVCAPNRNNKTGHRGVVRHQGRYRARIMADRTIHDLGMFDTAQAAAAAYASAKARLHEGYTP